MFCLLGPPMPWTSSRTATLTLQELVELLNVLVPALRVTDVDNDIKILGLGANHQAYSPPGQEWRIHIYEEGPQTEGRRGTRGAAGGGIVG